MAPAQTTGRVFIVASYEQNHICGGPQEKGIIKGFNKEGWFEDFNLVVNRYYMDTKRKNTTPEKMKQQAAIVLKQIEEFKPQVVVAIDDNAFREVGLPLAGRSDLAVVFSGLNGQPENYEKKKHFMNNRNRPGGNVTGVYEKLYAVRSIKVIRNAIPNARGNKNKIVAITDFTPTGNALTRQFELEMQNKPADIEFKMMRVHNWAEYTVLIAQLNRDPNVLAIYPVALSLRVSGNTIYTAPEIFKWTIAHSKKPEMALNYFFSEVGLFGGAAVNFQAMGALAGHKAGKILNGNHAGSLPIEDAPDYAIVFNLKRARQLGIDIPAPLLTAADFVYR